MEDDATTPAPGLDQAEAGLENQIAPLIATKIQVPRRRTDVLSRQRLVNFIHDHLDRKLILVSAPAGYGKTTLLADFAQDTDLPVCWYTLDAFDQDLRVFLEYFIAAIARRFPAFGERSRAFLQQVPDPGASIYPIVATLVQEIYDTIPEYFVLILDDHHTVENQDRITELLDYFVTYVDENCHLILASRMLPTLPNLSLLVARRQAAGLSVDELRFTPAEIQALASQNYSVGLNPEQAELLAQRTSGWITGLVLMAIRHWTQPEPAAFRGRINVDLYDYLSRQVLDQQAPSLRDFLLASSVLDELSPEMCNEVLRIDKAADFLEQVRARRLFAVEFEGGGEQLRYHDLFREFLAATLQRQEPDRYSELTRRAADAYARRGEWERAVSRYQALQEYESMAEIIERTNKVLFETGRWDTLAGWIDALPQASREGRPGFLAYRGKIHAERGEYPAALELLEQAEGGFEAAGDTARAAIAMATRGSVLQFQGRYAEAIAHCQKALAAVGGATLQERSAMALAFRNIGLCQLSLGHSADGREALEQALHLYGEEDASYDLAMVHHDLGHGLEYAGDLAGAVSHYQAALRSWQQIGSPGPWANTLNGLGVVYYLQGQYDAALPILKEALAKAAQAGDVRVQAYTWASLGDLYRDTGSYKLAQEAYTQALEVANQSSIGFVVTYALDGLGNTFRLLGELGPARKQLMRALDHARSQESAYETALCHVSLGIITGQEGKLVTARRHLDQALGILEASGSPQDLARVCLHRAQIAFQAGEQEIALDDLRRALSLSSRLGLDQFLVVEGQNLRPLLRFAIKRGLEREVLAGLLQRIEAHRAQIASRPEPVLKSEPQPELRIYALGQARVEVGGRPVQWMVAQSRDLLFCLLQHPQGLRKEQIGQILWPDHSPHKLDGIFRSTLYRLRRTLFGQCVVFEDALYRFNWTSQCWFDVEAFEGLLDQSAQSTGPQEALAFLEEALRLYQGDYLEGNYADWPLLERERLRDRHLGTLQSAAQLHVSLGNLNDAVELYQRLLTLDPYREAAHRELMRCYHRRGDRAAAIRQYKACTQILREDLGLSPAPETEAVYLEVIG